jgi:hypothetical protein
MFGFLFIHHFLTNRVSYISNPLPLLLQWIRSHFFTGSVFVPLYISLARHDSLFNGAFMFEIRQAL